MQVRHDTCCVPTLGYASKGAAILALRKEGKTHGEIGRMLGMPPRAVSSLACRARQNAERTKRIVRLDGNVFLDLERAARKRNMSAIDLAERLLYAIVTENLYDAVLDE